MKRAKRARVVWGLVLALLASSCALTSKGEVAPIRWFTPEVPTPRLTNARPAESRPAQALAVELGRVVSGINLRDKIAYRDDAFEVGFYDDKRWTERPEVYVRRALARALYEDYGMRRAFVGAARSRDGEAPVVDVEVVAFEQVRKPTPVARVELRVLVHDDRSALVERTIATDVPIEPEAKGFDAVVRAMAQALAIVSDETARVTEAALSLERRRSPSRPER
jgi:cholesterol transport system auxiliary component